MVVHNYVLGLLILMSFGVSLFAQDSTGLKADSGSIQVNTLKNAAGSACKSQLTILSEPAGAVAILDDTLTGKCPVTFTNVDTGDHLVQLKMKGYYLKKAAFRIDSCENKNLDFTLLQPGGVCIKSSPDSAEVFIADKTAGKTPLSFLKVKPGDYKLRIIKKNYKPIELSLTIRSGFTDTLVIPLSFTTAYQDSIKSAADQTTLKSRWTNRIVFASFAVFALVILLVETVGSK